MGNAEFKEIRLVLVGNTGSGKSSSGNTILGQKKFLAKSGGSSVTRKCQSGSTDRAFDDDQKRMRKITVVDMPGFGDTHLSMEEIYTEMAKCLYHAAPGPHAFLLVVPIERYTDYQAQAVNHLAKIFGDDAVKYHTIVLFTKGDSLEGMEFDEYLKESPDGLRELINKCGGRYHVFNNEENYGNATQVQELMMKVDKMAKKSETEFYTSAMFKEAEAAIRKEQKSECNGCNGALTQKVSLSSKLMGILKRIVAAGAVGVAIGVAFGAVAGAVCAAVAAVAACPAVAIGAAAGGFIGGGIVIAAFKGKSVKEGVSLVGGVALAASAVVGALSAGAGAGTLAAGLGAEVVQNTVKVATAVSAVAKVVKDKTKDSQKSYNK